MEFRFRKSFGGKYFIVNISKSGIGCSYGVPGLRRTKLVNGRTRNTASIKGNGISYVTETKGKNKINNCNVAIYSKGMEWLCKNVFKQKYLKLLEKYKMELAELYN